MPSAALPADEEIRLRALLDLDILDTSAEAEFDALVAAASLLCDAPVSLISLVDAERQWFKARVGLDDVSETPRELAFCSHAIHHGDILEVQDATRDARFADNPLVLDDPSIRFYAGAPLQLSSGERIGTLCVIDRKPRQLDDRQRRILALLASVAVRGLERRRDARLRAQLETQVRRLVDDSRADLEVQNLRKNRFMAVLSHELRGPLSAMVSGLGLLKLDRQLSEPSTKAIAVLQRQVKLMTDLVSDLLDVSRIGEGKVDLALAPVDLNDVVALAAETTLELVTSKRHVVSFDRAEGSLTTRADRRRLVQLVGNLMANAAKYSPAEGHITIRTRRDGDHAVLEVIDRGIGIDADALETVFNPFEQLDEGIHLSQGGLGIGLSLVRQIAELHGGTVAATSEGRGCGATFAVRLPLMQAGGASSA